MELQGKVTNIVEPQTIQTKNGARTKYGFVVDILPQGQYPQKAMFEVWDTRWDEMNGNVVVGEEVTVSYDINSREYNGRWFTSLNAWRVTKTTQSKTTPQPQPIPNSNLVATNPTTTLDNNTINNIDNDLPF